MAPAAAMAAVLAALPLYRFPNLQAAFALPRASPSRMSVTSGTMAPASDELLPICAYMLWAARAPTGHFFRWGLWPAY